MNANPSPEINPLGWAVLAGLAGAAIYFATRPASAEGAANCPITEAKFDAWVKTKDLYVLYRETEGMPPGTWAELKAWIQQTWPGSNPEPHEALVVTVPTNQFWSYTTAGPSENLQLKAEYCAFGAS